MELIDSGDNRVKNLLITLYGFESGRVVYTRLQEKIAQFKQLLINANLYSGKLSERDAILITYADQVKEDYCLPLRSFTEFCSHYLKGTISGIHLLPFFPYSSDDGFSVIDYRQVDPAVGTWEDVSSLAEDFQLMFDAVINHASVQSEWFLGYIQGLPRYKDYFIEVNGAPDLSQVVRPRALPLLTTFDSPGGPRQIWTTFSTDQADLNYQNPEVLLEIIDILLYYVSQGARFIRLDAIAFLWKEIGTPCIHLPQTHAVIQLFRAILSEVAPFVKLITETNVPHLDNISYFGDGSNEAHLVYNFALPPLVMHTLLTGDASKLSSWADTLKPEMSGVSFFNFLASHDGVGLNPAKGILSQDEINALVDNTIACGGEVSYKQNPDGSQSPYELNINYFDALNGAEQQISFEMSVDKFIAAHAILLALWGVPGIYFHSLFGSRGWKEGVQLTGRKRTINRQKLDRTELERELSDSRSLRYLVYSRMMKLIIARRTYAEFSPESDQKVIFFKSTVFSVIRYLRESKRLVLCLQNISDKLQTINIKDSPLIGNTHHRMTDIVSEQPLALRNNTDVSLKPYETLWVLLEC